MALAEAGVRCGAARVRTLIAVFMPRALGVRGRCAWAPDLMYPYGSNGLLLGNSGLPGWSRAVACGDPALGTIAEGHA